MITASDIRERLAAYIAEQASFTQFENWLLSHSLNMHKDSDAEAQELVLDMNEHIYACMDGLIDEATLRVRLTPLATQYHAHFGNVRDIRSADFRTASTAQRADQWAV